MKPYLMSLAVGLLVGVIYSLLGTRSPAPPAIALIGLLGILVGEQLLPLARTLRAPAPTAETVRSACANHVLGRLPANTDTQDSA